MLQMMDCSSQIPSSRTSLDCADHAACLVFCKRNTGINDAGNPMLHFGGQIFAVCVSKPALRCSIKRLKRQSDRLPLHVRCLQIQCVLLNLIEEVEDLKETSSKREDGRRHERALHCFYIPFRGCYVIIRCLPRIQKER